MKPKKILFAGLGGAGQRHLRILRKLLPIQTDFIGYRSKKSSPLLNSDFSIESNSSIEDKYNIKMLNSLEEAIGSKPDLIVISTPTALHYEIAKKAAEHNINVFVEKPFSNTLQGFEEFKKIIYHNKLCFFISFQRRYHPYLIKIKEIVSNGDLGKIISVNLNVGSYVPSWHPYENFKDLYACKKDLGGGVLLTEIHELDLCYWYFGFPHKVYCSGGNYSNTPIDVEDTAHIVLKYEGFSVQVNLCFMQKHIHRSISISGTKGYLEWNADGNELLIRNFDKEKLTKFSDLIFSNDDLFLNQASDFINRIGSKDNIEQLEIARASLALVEASKISMQTGKEIEIH
jgi:predicted dehydrogenase